MGLTGLRGFLKAPGEKLFPCPASRGCLCPLTRGPFPRSLLKRTLPGPPHNGANPGGFSGKPQTALKQLVGRQASLESLRVPSRPWNLMSHKVHRVARAHPSSGEAGCPLNSCSWEASQIPRLLSSISTCDVSSRLSTGSYLRSMREVPWTGSKKRAQVGRGEGFQAGEDQEQKTTEKATARPGQDQGSGWCDLTGEDGETAPELDPSCRKRPLAALHKRVAKVEEILEDSLVRRGRDKRRDQDDQRKKPKTVAHCASCKGRDIKMVLTLGGRWCHGQGSVGEGAALDKGECEELPLVSREGDPGRILGDPHTTRQEEVGEERSGKDENWEGELQALPQGCRLPAKQAGSGATESLPLSSGLSSAFKLNHPPPQTSAGLGSRGLGQPQGDVCSTRISEQFRYSQGCKPDTEEEEGRLNRYGPLPPTILERCRPQPSEVHIWRKGGPRTD
ncbi:hypothetical protein Cadr_000026138 [Camelus dromedarius]|uniref:Uncharacterized protein n=1 Tax=Camelus dromedarius TaxID=9838 RepID=A0A5N4CE98_CAMDR|nr:hypothetical protein Cadr_000026138 [Camelus dromedarius]